MKIDIFTEVKGQIKCKNHAISDAGYIKFIQDYLQSCYGFKVLEISWDESGSVEAILGSGEIITGLNTSMLRNLYHAKGMN